SFNIMDSATNPLGDLIAKLKIPLPPIPSLPTACEEIHRVIRELQEHGIPSEFPVIDNCSEFSVDLSRALAPLVADDLEHRPAKTLVFIRSAEEALQKTANAVSFGARLKKELKAEMVKRRRTLPPELIHAEDANFIEQLLLTLAKPELAKPEIDWNALALIVLTLLTLTNLTFLVYLVGKYLDLKIVLMKGKSTVATTDVGRPVGDLSALHAQTKEFAELLDKRLGKLESRSVDPELEKLKERIGPVERSQLQITQQFNQWSIRLSTIEDSISGSAAPSASDARLSQDVESLKRY